MKKDADLLLVAVAIKCIEAYRNPETQPFIVRNDIRIDGYVELARFKGFTRCKNESRLNLELAAAIEATHDVYILRQ